MGILFFSLRSKCNEECRLVQILNKYDVSIRSTRVFWVKTAYSA
jgi:hypothetical protein